MLPVWAVSVEWNGSVRYSNNGQPKDRRSLARPPVRLPNVVMHIGPGYLRCMHYSAANRTDKGRTAFTWLHSMLFMQWALATTPQEKEKPNWHYWAGRTGDRVSSPHSDRKGRKKKTWWYLSIGRTNLIWRPRKYDGQNLPYARRL